MNVILSLSYLDDQLLDLALPPGDTIYILNHPPTAARSRGALRAADEEGRVTWAAETSAARPLGAAETFRRGLKKLGVELPDPTNNTGAVHRAAAALRAAGFTVLDWS